MRIDIMTLFPETVGDMMNESIDSYITSMESIARIVVENSDVRSYLFTETGDERLRAEYGERAAELF